MSDSLTNPAASGPSTEKRTPTWIVVAIAVFFGLFYAYAVWNALGNLVQAAQLSIGLSALGWFVWIFATLFPLLVFVGAFAVGYRRKTAEYVLVLLTGLAVVAVFWLNLVAYTYLNTASLLG